MSGQWSLKSRGPGAWVGTLRVNGGGREGGEACPRRNERMLNALKWCCDRCPHRKYSRMAHLAYFDESGDAGLVGSPTQFFVLACVLVPEAEWMASLDSLVKLRTRLRTRHGIATRPEMKSTDIRRGRFRVFAHSL